MPLLVVPLVLVAMVLGLVLLWLLLMPLALWQRYRRGALRRRAVPWSVGANAWGLALSSAVFLTTAWVAGHWVPDAGRYAATGVLAGVALGVVSLWLTRFEWQPAGLFYTPNRWLLLALTFAVAARIGFGVWHAWQGWSAGAHTAQWVQGQGGLVLVGGVLLGHYLAYAWGLRARLRRHRRATATLR